MRTDYDWFKSRLTLSWNAQPTRSCLLIVPPGCNTHAVASEVEKWVDAHDPIAARYNDRFSIIVRITVDATSSSAHFVDKLGRDLSRVIKSAADVSKNGYPADWIEDLINAAQSENRHPILVIHRFHAFAKIADDHLLSVLATLRQLEHDGQLTTIAISPMSYQRMRQELSEGGKYPFVNSAYGDNHDQVIMPTMTRSEFVAASVKAGLEERLAQRLFINCGGPDSIHAAIIKAALDGPEEIVQRAAHLLGTSLEPFFDLAIGSVSQDRDDLRLRVATGQLQPTHTSYLRHQELSKFLLKSTERDRVIVASPVLGRLLLSGKTGPWVAYSKVMEAVDLRNYADATKQVAILERNSAYLEAFAHILEMLAALHDSNMGGLLEMDWKTAKRVGLALLSSELPVQQHRGWIEQIVRWSRIVGNAVDPGQGPGARLDLLTRQSTSADVQHLLVYAINAFLVRARRSGSPGDQVRAAASIPEAILQSILSYLDVDPLNVPRDLPNLNYQRYFGGLGDYRMPEVGNKCDLTHLLVLVPTMLNDRYPELRSKICLCDESFVKPLHQKLVAKLRNATAHTYSEIDNVIANYFFSICGALLNDAITIWDQEGTSPSEEEPGPQALGDYLYGHIGSK